jgi:hypothetical protein
MARIKRRLCYYRYKPNKKTYKNKPNNNVKAKISASQTNKRFKKIIFTKYSAINITHRTSFAQLTLDAQKKELLASRQDTYLLKKKLEAKNAEPKIFRP